MSNQWAIENDTGAELTVRAPNGFAVELDANSADPRERFAFFAIRQQARDLDQLRADLAAAVSENAALLAANRDLKAHFDALKGDYDEAAHFARHFIRDDAAITPRGAIIRLGDKCTSLFARMKIAETERDEWIACHAQLYRKLGNLLAVIHRDGGHYESEHGTEKACADAMQRICDTRAGLGAADELVMLVRRLSRALQKAAPDNDLPKTAMDYLSIAGLAGSPMRRDE